MAHHHHHSPSPSGRPGNERRLIASILLNLIITAAEVAGGLLSGSLALLSDALHNFSDTASLGISYGARRISRKKPTPERTFGFNRAEILGAFANLVTLVLVALFLMKEAVERLLDPRPVTGWVMLLVAVVGLLANLATALLLHRDAHGSLNIKSAFLHIVADAVSSVGVVLGAVLILLFDVHYVDPLLTLLISLYILFHSYTMLRETVDILMEGTPPSLDLERLIAAIQSVDSVRDMHHTHVWRIDEEQTALEAHIVIDKAHLDAMESIKQTVKQRLRDEFGITHSTLEFEVVPCEDGSDERCFEPNGRLVDTASP